MQQSVSSKLVKRKKKLDRNNKRWDVDRFSGEYNFGHLQI